MLFSKAETDVTADISPLSKTAGTDSSESTQHPLNETNQIFQDWLEDLSIPPNTESERHPSPYCSQMSPREISFEGTLTSNGYLAGVVYSPEGTLVLGENGEIDGDIFVNVAIIHGSVRGDVHATRKVELASGGKVIGDIETLELAIQPGAIFEGRCVFPHPGPNDQAAIADDQPEATLAATY